MSSRNIGSFTLGTAVRAHLTLENEDGTLTDPDTLTITFRQDGDTDPATYTLSSPELTRVSVGVYRFAPPTPAAPGTYRGHAITTSTDGTAEAGRLFHFTIEAGL